MFKRILLVGAGALALLALGALAGCAGPVGPAGPPGPAGVQGPAGPLAPGVDSGMNVTMELSKPANGTNLVAGEKMTVTLTLKDELGASLTKDDFATLGLYMYGPQDPAKTATAVKLLNASTDRTKTPHHYIDLLKDANVQASGNVLKYELQPVSDEAPGTYTASLRAIKKGDPPVNQAFVLVNFQLGTATVETPVVEKEKCAACHLGADSGQFYFAHVDPGRSPYGSPSIDSIPVATCKSCHNNEGYAAYTSPADGTTKVPDNIVFRVHGVHFGEELTNPANTEKLFKEYAGVIFPANVKNCTSCHATDAWKTKPSRLACGACHDQIDWTTGKSVVAGGKDHAGGPQTSDAVCATCHTPDAPGVAPISEVHQVSQPMNKIDVSLTPPANGKFYAAGEKPVLTLVIRDDKDNPIDHTTVDETTFSTASFFVYGPREYAVPVLTNAAKNGNSKLRASATSSKAASGDPKAWTFAEGDTFKIAVNGGAVQELAAPVGPQTPAQVVEWLKANLRDVTVSANAANNINLLSNLQGDNSKFEIYNSAVTTKMGWKPGGLDLVKEGVTYGKTVGTTVEPFVVIASASTQSNDLRPRKDPLIYTDPNVVRTPGNITYQLDDVAGLEPGTYMVYSYVLPVAKKNPDFAQKTGIGFITFQVGTETPSKKVATNCSDCHANTIWHLDEGPIHAEPFDTDYCLACHDYGRSGTGDLFSRIGGNSTSGWAGFGAKPIAARVHGVHRGNYLDHPEEVYAGNPNAFNAIIFPQDIRNCSKCHSADTTGTWKTEPSRLACNACHDSDKAKAHTAQMTVDPTPLDPFGSDATETCTVCHGAGREFSPDKVHKISNPYVPPYPREPERIPGS